MRAPFTFACATVFVVGAQIAHAERTALVSSGTAPLHERELAARVASDALQAQLGALAQSRFGSRDTASITRCIREASPWTCMRPVLQGKNLQQLVIASADRGTATDGSPTIIVNLQIVVESLDSVIGDTRYCDHCTDDVLSKLTSELVGEQLHALAIRLGHTVLKIRSVPRGARITLDGKPFGVTDATVNTFPGRHTLELALDHFQIEQRTLDVADGKTLELQAALRPMPAEPGPRIPPPPELPTAVRSTGGSASDSPVATNPPAQPSLVAPAVTVGLGVVAMLVGSGLVVWNGQPDARPGIDQSATYTDRSKPGVGLLIAGGAATAVGGVWLWRSMRRNELVTPVVSVTAHQAVLRVTRDF